MRELLRDNGLPEPDSVRHDPDEVAFFWHESKTVVIVDLDADDPPRRKLDLTRHGR
jgi:hypothetical protein